MIQSKDNILELFPYTVGGRTLLECVSLLGSLDDCSTRYIRAINDCKLLNALQLHNYVERRLDSFDKGNRQYVCSENIENSFIISRHSGVETKSIAFYDEHNAVMFKLKNL